MNEKRSERAKAQKTVAKGTRFHTLADVGRHFHLPEVEIDVSVTGRSGALEINDALHALVADAVRRKSVVNPPKSGSKRR